MRFLHKLLQVREVESPDFICYGDSLTVNSCNHGPRSYYSYPNILARLTKKKIGIAGKGGMSISEMVVDHPGILWIGTNDVANGRNMREVLDECERLYRPDIIFLNMIWRGDMNDSPRLQFNNEVLGIFDKVIDVASVMKPEHYHEDKVHLNHKGNRIVAETVCRELQGYWF